MVQSEDANVFILQLFISVKMVMQLPGGDNIVFIPLNVIFYCLYFLIPCDCYLDMFFNILSFINSAASLDPPQVHHPMSTQFYVQAINNR